MAAKYELQNETIVYKRPESLLEVATGFCPGCTHGVALRLVTEVIDEMVLQFPDHELTGFILLRLGQISEHNNQIEEAQEIYRTVANHFPQKPLKQQALVLLKSLEIQ